MALALVSSLTPQEYETVQLVVRRAGLSTNGPNALVAAHRALVDHHWSVADALEHIDEADLLSAEPSEASPHSLESSANGSEVVSDLDDDG